MDFQEPLLRVQDALKEDELQDLLFLCADLLGRRQLSSVSSGHQLFSLMQEQDLLSPEDPSLLLELLGIIKQNSLIRSLNGTLVLPQQQPLQRISTYRRFLYELSEALTDQDLKSIQFLLINTLPRRKLQKDMTALQLFLEMEKEDLLSENNLDSLQKIIGNIHPTLEKRIIQYKEENLVGFIIAEETEKFPSVSEGNSYTPSEQMSFTPVGVMEHQMEGLRLSGGTADAIGGQIQSLEFSSEIETQIPQSPVTQNPELEPYEMKGDRRGVCLIINNYDFSACNLRNREGTDMDKDRLEAVFGWLGFEVVTEHDCDRERMLRVLRDLAARDHARADCVVCCILSHGRENGVVAVDGRTVSSKELMESLSPLRFSSLAYKPKLFFIQACRGTHDSRPVFPQASPEENETVSDAAVPRDSIPETADFLLAMSTVPHYVSYREKESGTWFIQSLCRNLQMLVPRGVDLLSILTTVNRDVSLKSDKRGLKKQMPQPEFTLTRRLVFPPPKSPPPSL